MQPTYYVLCDWENNGDFAGDYDNLTARVVGRPAWTRGRAQASQLLARSEPGTARLKLRNHDGLFSTFNTSSPLYGNLVPNRRLQIRVAAPKTATAASFAAASSEELKITNGQPGSAAFKFGDEDFSIFFLHYPTDSGTQRGVLGRYNTGSNQRSYAFTRLTSQVLRFTLSADGSAATNKDLGTCTLNQWSGACVVHDAANNLIKGSLNGSALDAGTAHTGGAFANSTADLRIGGGSNVDPTFQGRKCFEGFWARQLTNAEITWLYNGGVGRQYGELGIGGTDGAALLDNLVEYFHLDEASGDRTGEHRGYVLADTNTVTTADGPETPHVYTKWTGYIEDPIPRWDGDEPVVDLTALGPLSQIIDRVVESQGLMDIILAGDETLPLSSRIHAILDGCRFSYSGQVLSDEPICYFRGLYRQGPTQFFRDHTLRHIGVASGSPTLGASDLIAGDDNDYAFALVRASSQYFLINNDGPTAEDELTCFDGVNPWMVEFPVKTTDIDTVASANRYLFNIGGSAGNDRIAAYLDSSSSTPRLVLERVVGGVAVTVNVVSNRLVRNDGWPFHVALWYDGSDLKVFIDGEEAGTAADTASMPAFAAGTRITFGAASDPVGYLSCTLDEIAIYGEALAAARIKAHFQAATWSRRAIEESISSVTFLATEGLNGLTALRDVEDGELGFLHETADGKIGFHHRYHRAMSTRSMVSQIELTDDPTANPATTAPYLIGLVQEDRLRNIVNHVEAEVQVYDNQQETDWTPELEFTLAPGEEYLLRLPLAAGAIETAIGSLGADDPTFDVAGVAAADIAIWAVGTSRSVFFLFKNFGTNVATISNLVYDYDLNPTALSPLTVTSEDGVSQRTYGARSYRFSTKAIEDLATARGFCNWVKTKHKDPLPFLEVPLLVNMDNDLFHAYEALDLADRASLKATGLLLPLGIDQDFFIEAIREDADLDEGLLSMTLLLSPVTGIEEQVWILDSQNVPTVVGF